MLRFLGGVAEALMRPDIVSALAAAPAAQMPALSVKLQREYLEHCGVEMDFGCAALSQVRAQP